MENRAMAPQIRSEANNFSDTDASATMMDTSMTRSFGHSCGAKDINSPILRIKLGILQGETRAAATCDPRIYKEVQ